MVFAMSAEPSWQVRHFTSLPSTNQYLLDQARVGAKERVGRRCRSPERRPRPPRAILGVASGGLAARVGPAATPAVPTELHLCPTAVALAALDACGSVAGVEALVKWPNDLVVDDHKLAGVLAEVLPDVPGGPAAAAVVVGLGLNIEWPGPPEVDGTSLVQLSGRSISRDDLLGALLTALERRRLALVDGSPGTALIAELRARCATLGRRVRVELASGSFDGTATDVTDHGLLVVDTLQGVREVAAGDVVHVRPALIGPSEGLH